MKKIEYVWRELLYQAIEKDSPFFSLTGLSLKFHLSTSVVSHALLPLRELHMIEVGKRGSKIIDSEKLLFFWATRRNIRKDLLYETYSKLPVSDREALMPASVYPTAYTACRFYFDLVPADYDTIYFYAKDEKEIKARFPQDKKRPANISILKEDSYLSRYANTPIALIFADLWNLPEWYSRDFADAVLDKIKEKIGL